MTTTTTTTTKKTILPKEREGMREKKRERDSSDNEVGERERLIDID